MKIIKKNQIIVYVIALMLVTAGYLNYTSENNTIETSTSETNKEIAQIGDATLVSSQDIIEENTYLDNTNTVEENIINSVIENTIETASKTENDYFVSSKLERTNMYSQMIDTYEKILENTNISETQKTVATQEITKISNMQNSIMICENLLKTKGFDNNIIFINDKSISVIIGKDTLEADEIAQIQNIVSRELNTEIDNIHITNK